MTSTGAHALLGDTRTAALSGGDGSIDWLCLPRFDGRPVFGALIGGSAAGRFAVGPAAQGPSSRRYRPGTPTVETTWETAGGRLTLTEGMVSDVVGTSLPNLLLVRRVEASGGPVDVVIDFDPRFGWDRAAPRLHRAGGALFASHGPDGLALTTDTAATVEPGRPTTVRVEPGRALTIALSGEHSSPVAAVDAREAWRALEDDEARWRTWTATLDVPDLFGDAVRRSLLTLRLLTYSPSGAPVAAPTTSLPEQIGGGRNWDYRYAWPRDASIGVAAFLGAGCPEEATRFLTWLGHAGRLTRPRLPPLLSLLGTPVPDDREIPGWPGFSASRPVRVGNTAAGQHQLDVYGWPLDAAELLVRQLGPVGRESWRALAALVDHVAANWSRPDVGLWEVRSEPRHFVHSKLMAWVALDRGLRLAAVQGTRTRRRARWAAARDAVARALLERGYDDGRGCYTRAFDGDDLDAALLLLPVVGFEPDGSERVARTVRAIADELGAGGGLVHRYTPGSDGLEGEEGAFLPCSFWLVQALARTGRVDEAMATMEQVLGLAGPLGLFAEEADPRSGAMLGNHPQALTHAAIVQAALALGAATSGRARARARPRTTRARPG